MTSPNQANVCFICLKQSSQHEGKSVSRGPSTSTLSLYTQFTIFVRKYFDIATVVENSLNGQVSDWGNHDTSAVEIEAFCEDCSKTVSQVCELYKELRSMELRLSTKLEELGILIKEIKNPILASGDGDGCLSTSSLLKSLAVQLRLPTETVFDLRNSILSKLFQKSVKKDREETEIKEEVESLPDDDGDGEDQNELGSEYSGSESSDDHDETYLKDDETCEAEPVGRFAFAARNELEASNAFEEEDDYEGNENEDCSESDNQDDKEDSHETDSEYDDIHEKEPAGEMGVKRARNAVDSDQPDDEDYEEDDNEDETATDSDSNDSSFEMETDDETEEESAAPPPQTRRSSPHKKVYTSKLNAKKLVPITAMLACEANGCREFFKDIPKLNQHLQTHSTTIHSCSECKKGFLNPDLLELHKLLHTKKVRGVRGGYLCPWPSCTSRYNTAKQLEIHFNRTHGLGLGCFKCPKCDLNLSSERRLKMHLKKHEEAKDPSLPISEALHCIAPPPCSICGLQFLHFQNLDEHRKKIHGLGVECPTCHKLFSSRDSMNRHEHHHHDPNAEPSICPFCGKSLKTNDYLQNHIVTVHPDKVNREGRHQCPHCQTRFFTKPSFQFHLSKCEKNPNRVKRVYATSKNGTPGEISGRRIKRQREKMERHVETHKKPKRQIKDRFKNKISDQDNQDDDFIQEEDASEHKSEALIFVETMLPCEATGCRAYFENVTELNAHLQTHSTTLHFCSECNKGFLEPEFLSSHKLLHTKKVAGKYQCPLSSSCSSKFDRAKDLQFHFNLKHGLGLGCFKCPKCELNLGTEQSLVKHLNKHNEAKDASLPITEALCFLAPPPCYLCGLQFLRFRNLDAHREKIHNLGFQCHICEKFFSNRQALKVHNSKRHKSELNICSFCGQPVGSKENLKQHIFTFHKKPEKRPSEKSKVKSKKQSNPSAQKEPFVCDICGKQFTYKPSLTRHLNMHHGIGSTPEKMFQCHICGNSYSSNVSLTVHVKVAHNDEKKFTCHLSPFKTNVKESLRSHLRRIHGKIRGQEFATDDGTPQWRKKKCRYPTCNQEFGEENELKSHVEQEHQSPTDEGGAPTFMCNLCGRTFANQQRLTRHNQVHSEVKPYSCDICQKPLSHRSAVKEHLQNMHGVGKEKEFFSCTQPNCNSSTKFKSRTYLYRHLRRVHGILMKNQKKN
ncbi:unnamed protein product [Orchesella dallaii]|uniref:C2H2-type domain-containing protein n=1 Tax=Orchesella dallaii TaxID=48710 RepID=A0ABP1RHJ4_9HEXA